MDEYDPSVYRLLSFLLRILFFVSVQVSIPVSISVSISVSVSVYTLVFYDNVSAYICQDKKRNLICSARFQGLNDHDFV